MYALKTAAAMEELYTYPTAESRKLSGSPQGGIFIVP
jgi:hypothetical protein